MFFVKELYLKLISNLPKSKILYNFCKQIVDKYYSQNNCNIYTNGELRVMQTFLKKFRVIFDIGSNIGEWTKLALDINKDLEIHCFEPSQYTFKKLIENNFSDNVICNNIGLSSRKGERTFFIFENGSGLNSLYKRIGSEYILGEKLQDKEETILLDTLENYCSERNIKEIDFIKIDTEGHELEVLKGGESLIKKGQIKVIQFEYGGTNIDSHVLLKDIFNFFNKLDYSFYKIFPKHLKLIKKYDSQFENFQYQNWLIVKNENVYYLQ